MCVCIWGGIREVGLGSRPFKKRAALGPGGSSLMESPGPHCFLYWPWGALCKDTPSPQSALTYLMGTGAGEGRADPALAMLWGACQRIQGQGWAEGRLSKLALSFLCPDQGQGPLLQL